MISIDKYYFNKYDIDYIKGGLLYVEFLMSYKHASCALLEPMKDEERPTMKLSIVAIHSKNYCYFSVYNSGDGIN